ncbi:MAG: hypothetical protein JO048_00990, partial [Methylobacteriaceae bacterium]|nr:hypothetical protein [Methylobacteriaceae bacterium]
HAEVIGRWAAEWRLGPRRRMDECLSPFATVSQTVAGFDFPRHALPDTFHHCGPLRRSSAAARPSRAGDRGRPLVFASLGTLQGARIGLFRAIAMAARELDLQLVVAHGGRLTRQQAASLPGGPAVYDFVRQEEVLARASLAVLNGGLNTVMDSLAAGVPAVLSPLAFEQGAIAARLERAGAGRRVSPFLAGSRRFSRAMRHALQDPSYRAAAGRLRAEIAGAGGVRRAADIVEAVLQTARPVTRADMASQAPARGVA